MEQTDLKDFIYHILQYLHDYILIKFIYNKIGIAI